MFGKGREAAAGGTHQPHPLAPLGNIASSSASKLQCLWRDIRGGHAGGHHHINDETVAAAAAAAATATKAVAGSAPWGLPLYTWKILFQLALTSLNVICWYVPLRNQSLRENELGLSLANAFSGGVFLALAFGHLIPECVASFPHGFNEATPYMIMLVGYLLIFFVEKVAFDAHGMMEHHHHHDDEKKSLTDKSNTSNGTTKTAPQPQNSNGLAVSGGGTGEGTGQRSAVILLGALGVHSILEMASLGLSNNFKDCALLSLSIGLHQPAESIALLVAFLKSGMPVPQVITYLSIFSAMGPIGVSLGMAVNRFASPIVDSTMLAIVAGTFIYVGATEVIPEEWEVQDHKWKKFVALMLGVGSIYGITQYTMGLEAGS